MKSILLAFCLTITGLLADPVMHITNDGPNVVVTWEPTNYFYTIQGSSDLQSWYGLDGDGPHGYHVTNYIDATTWIFPIVTPSSGWTSTNVEEFPPLPVVLHKKRTCLGCDDPPSAAVFYRLQLLPPTEPNNLSGYVNSDNTNHIFWWCSEHAQTQEIWRMVDDVGAWQLIATVAGNCEEWNDNLNDDGPYYPGYYPTIWTKFSYIIKGKNALGDSTWSFPADFYPFIE